MVRRYIIALGILLAGFWSSLNAQDAHFSQFYANPLYLNPALAGGATCPRVCTNYRNQWPGLGQTYQTYSVSYDQFVGAIHGGVGLNVFHDIQANGAYNTTAINGMYSYTLQLSNKFYLSGGFQASFMMKRLNWDFIYPDMLDPVYGPIFGSNETQTETKANYADFSVGFIGFSEKTFLGVAVHHLTEPSESFLRQSSDAVLKRKFTAHFGTEFEINSRSTSLKRGDFKLSPQILFYQQGPFQQFNWGLYLMRKELIVGLWARQNFSFHYDAIIMILGFRFDNIGITYSYDLTVSELSRSAYGSHEVSLSFIFGCQERAKKRKAVRCPSFF